MNQRSLAFLLVPMLAVVGWGLFNYDEDTARVAQVPDTTVIQVAPIAPSQTGEIKNEPAAEVKPTQVPPDPVRTHARPERTVKPTPSRSSRDTDQSVISTARKYLGTPYRYGGSTPAGFDCSGFISYVYKANGVKLPRVASDQAKVGSPVSRGNLQPGDLVFFDNDGNGQIGHVGIYIGDNRFIHASSSKGVTITPMNDQWYSLKYKGARRIE